ncbi:MAG TPA: hypothetical protein VFV57_08600 [Limnobacter sp.]|nr:hypothetical protein [Limnobacter sp.]
MASRALNLQQVQHLAQLHHQQLAWRMDQFCGQTGLPRSALPFGPAEQTPATGDCYIWVCTALCRQVLSDVPDPATHLEIAKAICAGAPLRWFALAHQWFEGLQFALPLQSHALAPDLLPRAIATSRQWRVQALPPFEHFAAHQWPVTCTGLQGEAALCDDLASLVIPGEYAQLLACESDALGVLPWLNHAGLVHNIAALARGLSADPWQISAHPHVATLRWGCLSSTGFHMVHQSELLDVRQGQHALSVQSPRLDDAVLLKGVVPSWQDPRQFPHVQAGFAAARLAWNWGWGDVLQRQCAEQFCVALRGEVALQADAWIWHGECLLDDLHVQFKLRPASDVHWQIEESARLSPEQLTAQPALLTWTGQVPMLLTLACPVEVGLPVLVPHEDPAGMLQITCALVYKPAQGRLVVQVSLDVSELRLVWSTHSPCGMVRATEVCWSPAKSLWSFEVDHG